MRMHRDCIKIFHLDEEDEQVVSCSFSAASVMHCAFDKFNSNTWMIIKLRGHPRFVRIKAETREELFVWIEMLQPSN